MKDDDMTAGPELSSVLEAVGQTLGNQYASCLSGHRPVYESKAERLSIYSVEPLPNETVRLVRQCIRHTSRLIERTFAISRAWICILDTPLGLHEMCVRDPTGASTLLLHLNADPDTLTRSIYHESAHAYVLTGNKPFDEGFACLMEAAASENRTTADCLLNDRQWAKQWLSVTASKDDSPYVFGPVALAGSLYMGGMSRLRQVVAECLHAKNQEQSDVILARELSQANARFIRAVEARVRQTRPRKNVRTRSLEYLYFSGATEDFMASVDKIISSDAGIGQDEMVNVSRYAFLVASKKDSGRLYRSAADYIRKHAREDDRGIWLILEIARCLADIQKARNEDVFAHLEDFWSKLETLGATGEYYADFVVMKSQCLRHFPPHAGGSRRAAYDQLKPLLADSHYAPMIRSLADKIHREINDDQRRSPH